MNYTKLNVGSRDEIKSEPWLNIDMENCSDKPNFMQMDLFNMPQEWNNQFEEVHAVHVLEHVNRNNRQLFLEEMYRVTKTGGSCFIEVPDFRETIRLLHEAYEKGDLQAQHIWTTSIYGKQRGPGDQHCWGYTNASLTDLFHKAGFDVTVWNTGWQGNWKFNVLQPISPHHRSEPVLLVKGTKL